MFIILRFKDGALDDDLVKEFDGFPVDNEGKPTFLPSATWFLKQIEFSNGQDLQYSDHKVITAGKDLKLILRLEGVFFERFELQAFPFDLQAREPHPHARRQQEKALVPCPSQLALLDAARHLDSRRT